MGEWAELLAKARGELGLSQADLALRAHVSLAAVKAYEQGKRHPARPYLVALLDALKLERARRNQIMQSAGYATDGLEVGPWGYEGFMFTVEEAADMIASVPWPAFIANEMMEVVTANPVAQRLWGVDLRHEFLDAIERNLLSVASNPRFASRCTNLPEAFLVMAAVFKGHYRGPEALENPSPYFAAVLERFLRGEQRYIQPFLDAWQRAEPRTPKVRWEYPVVWEEPGAGVMRFRCFVSAASEPDGLAFNDWVPCDAASWEALSRVGATVAHDE
jgi:transcriptional regulator with XRE-family HTH domain